MSGESNRGVGEPAVPNEELMRIVDPVGAIQKLAQDLWVDAGSPAEKSWRHFWSLAEQKYMGGEGRTVPKLRKQTPLPDEVPARIVQLHENAQNIIISVLAGAFRKYLSKDEAKALCHILRENRVVLKDGTSLGPWSEGEIAGMLALLCDEYPGELLEKYGVQHFESVPLPARYEYWVQTDLEERAADAPLNYFEQNVIRRLQTALREEESVQELRFLDD